MQTMTTNAAEVQLVKILQGIGSNALWTGDLSSAATGAHERTVCPGRLDGEERDRCA